MAVTVDNTGKSGTGLSSTTVTIASFTVGSGSDRCIYLGVSQWKASDTQPTAKFNTSETFTVHDSQTIAEAPGTRRVTIFKLVNPSVTTASIVVTWASAVDEAVAGATSWFGVDQATPFSAATKGSGTAASSSINLTGASGDVTHDTISCDADSSGTGTATPNRTQRWRAVAAADTTEGAGQSTAGTGGAVAHTWSTLHGGGSAVYAHIGVALQQSTGGGGGSTGTSYYYTMMNHWLEAA
jgi:hypothetical protein